MTDPHAHRRGGRRPAAAFAASSRACKANCDTVGECDGPEKALTGFAVAAPLALLVALWRRARRSSR